MDTNETSRSGSITSTHVHVHDEDFGFGRTGMYYLRMSMQ